MKRFRGIVSIPAMIRAKTSELGGSDGNADRNWLLEIITRQRITLLGGVRGE
jgi:hypothetical protein